MYKDWEGIVQLELLWAAARHNFQQLGAQGGGQREFPLQALSAGGGSPPQVVACSRFPAHSRVRRGWLRQYRPAAVPRFNWADGSCDIPRWIRPGARAELQGLVSREGSSGAALQQSVPSR